MGVGRQSLQNPPKVLLSFSNLLALTAILGSLTQLNKMHVSSAIPLRVGGSGFAEQMCLILWVFLRTVQFNWITSGVLLGCEEGSFHKPLIASYRVHPILF